LRQPDATTAGRIATAADATIDSRWVENRAPTGRLPRLDLGELAAYRELALVLALKDLRVRYKQTFFGVAWALLQPLVAAGLFSIFFGRLGGLPADGLPYLVFAYAGMVIWLYFAAAVAASAQSLVDNRDLVTKVYFPRLLMPLAAIVPPLVDFGLALVVLAAFLVGFGVGPGIAVALAPLWIAFAVVVALGVGLWLSALNVRYRDVRHLLPFLLQVWLFASPVVYASSLVEGAWRFLYAVNPMVAVVDGFRWSAAGAPAPGAEIAVSLVVTVALVVSGYAYFRRVERHFADVI
jgi:lipopolysaccharide transport system permease protein